MSEQGQTGCQIVVHLEHGVPEFHQACLLLLADPGELLLEVVLRVAIIQQVFFLQESHLSEAWQVPQTLKNDISEGQI